MKKNIITSLLFVVTILSITSCSKTYVQQNPPGSSTTSSGSADTTTISIGTWAITTYTQRTEDKTSLFDGYVFTFSSDGSLKAEKNGNITNGTWQHATPVTYYGVTTAVNTAFTINMGAAMPLSLLTKSWNVDSSHSSASKLSLISPEPIENMHLNFSKQ
jgi:hypothetical protein